YAVTTLVSTPPHHLLPRFFFHATPTSEIYTLSLHDALPIYQRTHPLPPVIILGLESTAAGEGRSLGVRWLDRQPPADRRRAHGPDRKSTRLNSSHVSISYAVFCLKKKKHRKKETCTGRDKS